MTTTNMSDKASAEECEDEEEDEFTFYVDLPGLAIVGDPSGAVKAIAGPFNGHPSFDPYRLVERLLGTLDLQIDDVGYDDILDAFVYTTTVRKEGTHAES